MFVKILEPFVLLNLLEKLSSRMISLIDFHPIATGARVVKQNDITHWFPPYSKQHVSWRLDSSGSTLADPLPSEKLHLLYLCNMLMCLMTYALLFCHTTLSPSPLCSTAPGSLLPDFVKWDISCRVITPCCSQGISHFHHSSFYPAETFSCCWASAS